MNDEYSSKMMNEDTQIRQFVVAGIALILNSNKHENDLLNTTHTCRNSVLKLMCTKHTKRMRVFHYTTVFNIFLRSIYLEKLMSNISKYIFPLILEEK